MNAENRSKLTRSDAGNCWVYGCATVVIVGIVGAIVAVFAAKAFYNKLVEETTDVVQVELPAVDASADEQTKTIEGFDTWKDAVENEEPGTNALHLSQQDINILIQHHPDFEKMSDYMFVTIDESEISSELSVPLDFLGWESLEGRFFNGSVKLDIAFEDGYLRVYAKEASLKGEPISDEIMGAFRSENLAKDQQNNPQLMGIFEHLESVEIVDGELIITPLGTREPAEEEAPREAVGTE